MKCNLYLRRSFALFLALLFAGTSLWAQSKTVQGSVTDAAGAPLIGVSVTVKGTTTGVTTDAQGKYSIKVPNAQAVLVFNYLGYVTQETTVGAKNTIDISLAEDAENIDEVVVIGYGAVKKRDLTGAVQSVKSEDIVMTPTGNVMEALQGKVAGLDITRSSGKAGAGVNMALRGNRSINGSNKPLFIIDGVEGNYEDLNTNDIQSVEILKDASSTAIYGSAGANGVIIITTKSGTKGKLNVNFDAYYGINGMTRFPKVRSGQDYIELRRQARITSGKWSPGDSDSQLFSPAEWEAIQNNQWVDWFKEGTRTGAVQNYSLSMSGGTEKTTGYFSANYYNEEGIMKGDDNTRYSFRANVEHKINNWLKGGLNVSSAFTDQNQRKGQFYTRVLCLMPLGTPYNPDGTINPLPLAGDKQLSPIADMAPDQYVNNYHILGINPTAYLELTPLKGLSIKTMFSSYLNFSRQGVYQGAFSADGYSQGTSSATVANDNTYNYKWENILNYNFMLGQDHNFGLTGVISWTKNQKEHSEVTGKGLDWDKYLFHNLGASKADGRDIKSSYRGSQLMSYVARINYSYKGRYLLTVSSRWDGSSIMAPGHKWDVFPAAAVAWRISDEPFMANADKIDNLKLRVGYGVTGNAGADPYATLNFGEAGSNLAFQEIPAPYYIFSKNIANPNLGWEKSYNTNVGVDLNMFRNRLNVTVDGYHTKTEDILYKRNLPASIGGYKAGNYVMWENICATTNYGVEAVINSVNIQKRNFNWTTTLTFASNHEEITSFTSDTPVKNGDTYLAKGHPMHAIYAYLYAGIWQEYENDDAAKYKRVPGDVKVVDTKPDFKYDDADKQILGATTPKWTAGLSNTFTYKGFDLTVFLQARWGQLMNYKILGWYNPSGEGNGPAICDYWTPENPSGHFPRPNSGYSSFAKLPAGSSSATIIDASYVKVRNLTLGYTLPSKWLDKVKISKARIYVTASNPFIFTKSKYLKDYDPELGGADEYPLTRQVVFGLNVSF